MRPVAAFFWRKLDGPGHDSCRLFELPKAWFLTGSAVFHDSGKPCHLAYEVVADTAWKTKRAKVCGFAGSHAVALAIRCSATRQWTVDGIEQGSVAGCVDLDLGFTPATNLIAIRRLSLKVGQRSEAPAAYLTFPALRIEKLVQIYRRTGRTAYEYEAPRFSYKGTLAVSPLGARRCCLLSRLV